MDDDRHELESATELRHRLTRAYLAGDGAAVVQIMELLQAAEARERTEPSAA
jgi:hypothetical protein